MTKSIEVPGIALPPGIVDDLTRREFLVGAGLIALAPACGSGEEGGDGPSGETRTVEHMFGSTGVPVEPKRVAALFVTVASALVSVGIEPVALVENTVEFCEPLEELLEPDINLSEVESIGSVNEFSLERLAALEPDLIVGTEFNALDKAGYERVSEIAPTVIFEYPGTERWRELFEEVTGAVGRSEKAGEVMRRYEEALDQARRQFDGSLEISFVRISDGASYILDTSQSFAGQVATEMGLAVTEGPEGVGERPNEAIFEVSIERLDLVTGDVIVLPRAWADEEESSLDALSDQPLWQRLPAVRAGRIVEVDLGVYNGGTYLAGQLLAEALAEAAGE